MTAQQPISPASPTVAVVGAYGHTGRFVVAELLRRGARVLAIGRDAGRLAQAHQHPCVELRPASLTDSAALDAALSGAAAVIHCAGPFLDSAEPVVQAALRARIHYLDVTAEQASAKALFEAHGPAAHGAGVVILPAMGFYGGLADLLATAALDDWTGADEVEIGIALDHWWPTKGTRVTGQRNTVPRLILQDGQLVPLAPSTPVHWRFPEPFGEQEMAQVPFSEIVLLSRHLAVRAARTFLATRPLQELRNPDTPPPTAADATGRSPQRFLVEVRARRGDRERRVAAAGHDIYAFSAPLIVEAALRLLAGAHTGPGVKAPGELFDAWDFLRSLRGDLDLQLHRETVVAAREAAEAPAA